MGVGIGHTARCGFFCATKCGKAGWREQKVEIILWGWLKGLLNKGLMGFGWLEVVLKMVVKC